MAELGMGGLRNWGNFDGTRILAKTRGGGRSSPCTIRVPGICDVNPYNGHPPARLRARCVLQCRNHLPMEHQRLKLKVAANAAIVALACLLSACTMLPDTLQPPAFQIPPRDPVVMAALPEPVPVEELLPDSTDEDRCEHRFAVIQRNVVNLRERGTTESAILDKASRNTRLLVTGHERNWIRVKLLDGRAEAWVREDLVGLECIVDLSQTIAADRLDLFWRSGAIFNGMGTASQAANLYPQPSAEEPAVGQVDAGQLLVIETVIEDDQEVLWARVQARQPDELPAWIRADEVRVWPGYLTDFHGANSYELGSQVQIAALRLALDQLIGVPASDGGRTYDRGLWIPRNTSAPATQDPPCDLTCRLLEAGRLPDGSWYLPWEDRTETDPSQLVAEPVVPLYEAHLSEGWRWSPYDRHTYAGPADSRRVHVLMSIEQRHRRGAADPALWQPETRVGQCRYAADWIRVKHGWGMTVDDAERAALRNILVLCDDLSLVPSPSLGTGSIQASGFAGGTDGLRVACDARSELITITNPSTEVYNLAGWHLHDHGNLNRFTLPEWLLVSGAKVTLGSGDAEADIRLTDQLIWNNDADTAYLYDRNYRLITARECSDGSEP